MGVTVKGVGYRLDPAELPDPPPKRWFYDRSGAAEKAGPTNFPHTQPASALRLKVGFSATVLFPLPPGVRAFCLRPTLTYLYGVDKALVRSTAMAVRRVRPPNAYTGNGIQLTDEVVRLRPKRGTK